jgi:hypothetical protein
MCAECRLELCFLTTKADAENISPLAASVSSSRAPEPLRLIVALLLVVLLAALLATLSEHLGAAQAKELQFAGQLLRETRSHTCQVEDTTSIRQKVCLF